ncbi:MAG TPA: ABC transporter permease [Anaerolineae bacterium]|nr:ABC transporter permease [Anaerolineae bacterium]
MRGLTKEYLLRRFLLFILTLWLGATILFILPRLAPGDPVQAMVARMRQQGTRVQDSASIIAAWRARFGLDDPLPVQYLRYISNLARGDMGYSLTYFPATVGELIGRALPWTIGLLTFATIIAFVLGTIIGALMGWRGTPSAVKNILPFSLVFTSIPSFMFSILLIYLFGFALKWFPITGGYDRGVEVGWNWEFISSAIQHSILPAISIIVVSMGFVALGMRGMMITVANEDYLVLAKIKGLRSSWIFWRYAVRNSILPQITAFALGLGSIVAGATIVETMFSYPGMGHLMYQAISSQDYALIGGIGFLLIATTATAVFVLDLIYPMIDPRITYKKK